MFSSDLIRPVRCWGVFTLLLAGVVAAAGGCRRTATTPDAAPPATADAALQSMVDAYQSAAAYQDHGVIRLRYRREGRSYQDEAPLSVRWRRPNRVQIQAYQVRVACDGQTMHARIRDANTKDFDGQIVERPAPATLGLADLYEHDEILALAFRQGLAGYPLQLDLLLGSEPLAALRSDQATRELLEPSTIDGRSCDRIAVDTTDGHIVLWVDRESHLLRRAEFPAATFAREIVEDQSVEDVQLTAELRGATWACQIPDREFALESPPDSKRVRKFIPPPREIPSELIGQTASAFAFADLAGKTVSSESLGDRIKVLVWFNNHPACQASVQQLNRVYQWYKTQPRVAMYAVCTEPSTTTDAQVSELLRSWRVGVPAVRDVQAVGRDLFQIPWAPTTVVLDGDNVLHIFEIGANPNLVAELPQLLERLMAGENLATEIRGQFQKARAAYERALVRGQPETEEEAAEVTPAAAATLPQMLQLRPAWTSTEVQSAGNILAVDNGPGDTRFLVHDGWRTLVELDGAGRVVARHELDLPASAGVSQLQTASLGPQQRYYVAWSLRSPQAHVFDAQWRRVLSYPPETVAHDGVQDALLVDLDGDGKLELCVGFWGTTGVHCVSLDGVARWTNREVTHVYSLAVAPEPAPPCALWVASASGQVVPLDHRGQTGPFENPTGQLIHHVFRAGDTAHSPTPYCGIAYGTGGSNVAIGLTAQPDSQWRYDLPAGSFENQIRFVVAARMLDSQDAQWLIAGPEGSVHVVSQDGRFTDVFRTGRSLAGLAGGQIGSQRILVISSAEGVQAWEVSPPSTAARHQSTNPLTAPTLPEAHAPFIDRLPGNAIR